MSKLDWRKFQRNREFPFSDYPWMRSRTISEFLASINHSSQQVGDNNYVQPVLPERLLGIANSTKNTGTNKSSGNDLGLPLIIGAAHQPNLFPSLNILALPLLLDILAKISNSALREAYQVFYLLDYDVAGDNRFRVAHLPSYRSKTGFYSISIPVEKSDYNKPMFRLRKPTTDWLKRSFEKLSLYVKQEFSTNRKKKHQYQENIDQCHELAENCLDEAVSLTEFNSLFISRIVSSMWGLPTLFIPGSLALREATVHFEFLWDRSDDIFAAKKEAANQLKENGIRIRQALIGHPQVLDFWYICECGERLSFYSAGKESTIIKANCHACGKQQLFSRKEKEAFRDSVANGQITPRIVADDLFDIIAWSYEAGVGYQSGAEHYLFSSFVALNLGLSPLPEFLWRADAFGKQNLGMMKSNHMHPEQIAYKSRLRTALEYEALGRASSLYYLAMRGFENLKADLVESILFPRKQNRDAWQALLWPGSIYHHIRF